MPNMMSPPGPKVKEVGEGSISLWVSIEAVIIYLRMVLRPMLKKRMMKIEITAREMKPPVAVV